jgi:putative flippase GtrA
MKKKDLNFSLISGLLIGILSSIVFRFGLNLNSYWLLWIITISFLSVLGAFIASIIGRKIPVIWQFAKFILSGSLSALVDLSILNLLMFLTGFSSGIFFIIFKGLSFLFAVTNSYFWNKTWTFEKKEGSTEEASKFFLISSIGFIINISTAFIVVNIIGPKFGINLVQWANIGSITAILVAMLWNFIGFKFLVFKK